MAVWVIDVVESEVGVVTAGVMTGASVALAGVSIVVVLVVGTVVDSVVGEAVVAAGASIVEVAELEADSVVEVEEHLDEKPLSRPYTITALVW